MPTRNVVVTDYQAGLLERLVSSGRYQNASEVLREGLRLAEDQEAQSKARTSRVTVAKAGISCCSGTERMSVRSKSCGHFATLEGLKRPPHSGRKRESTRFASSGGYPRRLARKSIPRECLIQKQDLKCDEDDDRDNLLNDLELKSRELDIAETIRGDRQAVFEQCDAPRDQDRSPERPVVPVFQVPVPGESHEDIRKSQQQDGAHRFGLSNCLPCVCGIKKYRMPNAAAALFVPAISRRVDREQRPDASRDVGEQEIQPVQTAQRSGGRCLAPDSCR